jgi:hypothetical protein
LPTLANEVEHVEAERLIGMSEVVDDVRHVVDVVQVRPVGEQREQMAAMPAA